MADKTERQEKWHRYWDEHAPSYDKQMGFLERRLFGDTRAWICAQATGDVLEVGIGTGLNLPFYPREISLTGIDLSQAMLKVAAHRAETLDRPVHLQAANAHALPFPDATFDTVVSTFSLCAIPDHDLAVKEMSRVLRLGGRLLLADHIAGPNPLIRTAQRVVELISIPTGGEHFRRRPLHQVTKEGLTIERRERFSLGLIERLTARKPTPG